MIVALPEPFERTPSLSQTQFLRVHVRPDNEAVTYDPYGFDRKGIKTALVCFTLLRGKRSPWVDCLALILLPQVEQLHPL